MIEAVGEDERLVATIIGESGISPTNSLSCFLGFRFRSLSNSSSLLEEEEDEEDAES